MNASLVVSTSQPLAYEDTVTQMPHIHPVLPQPSLNDSVRTNPAFAGHHPADQQVQHPTTSMSHLDYSNDPSNPAVQHSPIAHEVYAGHHEPYHNPSSPAAQSLNIPNYSTLIGNFPNHGVQPQPEFNDNPAYLRFQQLHFPGGLQAYPTISMLHHNPHPEFQLPHGHTTQEPGGRLLSFPCSHFSFHSSHR